jgi:hypothetical protein
VLDHPTLRAGGRALHGADGLPPVGGGQARSCGERRSFRPFRGIPDRATDGPPLAMAASSVHAHRRSGPGPPRTSTDRTVPPSARCRLTPPVRAPGWGGASAHHRGGRVADATARSARFRLDSTKVPRHCGTSRALGGGHGARLEGESARCGGNAPSRPTFRSGEARSPGPWASGASDRCPFDSPAAIRSARRSRMPRAVVPCPPWTASFAASRPDQPPAVTRPVDRHIARVEGEVMRSKT